MCESGRFRRCASADFCRVINQRAPTLAREPLRTLLSKLVFPETRNIVSPLTHCAMRDVEDFSKRCHASGQFDCVGCLHHGRNVSALTLGLSSLLTLFCVSLLDIRLLVR